MIIFVNDKPVSLAPGMSVRHALIHEQLLASVHEGAKVYDNEDNEIDLDGTLCDGARIRVDLPVHDRRR